MYRKPVKKDKGKMASNTYERKVDQIESGSNVLYNPHNKTNIVITRDGQCKDSMDISLFNMPTHLNTHNDTLGFARNGPIKAGHKGRSKTDSNELIKNEQKEEIKSRQRVTKVDGKRMEEVNRQRKPTPLSKDRKPSVPINPMLQKRQTAPQHQRPPSPGIYAKPVSRSKEIIKSEPKTRSVKQSSTSMRGTMIRSKVKT